MTEPRIYVACLAAYNAGKLHGAWIDAAQDAGALQGEIDAMLADSPEPGAEEWAIHDYEGFGPIYLAEHEALGDVAALANGIAEHGLAFAAWVAGNWGGAECAAEAADGFEDCYYGAYDDAEEWAAELFEHELSKVPAPLASYVDLESLARDLLMDEFCAFREGSAGPLHIFRRA